MLLTASHSDHTHSTVERTWAFKTERTKLELSLIYLLDNLWGSFLIYHRHNITLLSELWYPLEIICGTRRKLFSPGTLVLLWLLCHDTEWLEFVNVLSKANKAQPLDTWNEMQRSFNTELFQCLLYSKTRVSAQGRRLTDSMTVCSPQKHNSESRIKHMP